MGTTFKTKREEQLLWVEQAEHSRKPAEYEGRYNQWNEGKSHDSAKDKDVEDIEGRDKSQGCDGTEDVEEVAQVPKASDSAHVDATDVETIR